MSKSKANAVVGQSGGPTSVINRSLVGVIREARKHGHIGRLLGARHGVRGIINDDFIELNDVSDDLLTRIGQTPASALRSTRDKPDKDYCKKIFQSFQKHDVRYFFYIGGNDSADTARIVGEMARDAKYDLTVFHIPKTIDNDLVVHDHCPGYGSAAKFVACAIMGDNFDNLSLLGIKIDIIMGRHAGFVTAASVLARQHPEDGPHLIYVPEKPLTEEKFLADIDRVYSKHGRCLVALSEGVTRPDNKTWAEALAQLEKDDFGNVQLANTGLDDYLANLVEGKLTPAGGKKLRVRADTFGYLQRSFPVQAVSESDAREATLVGEMAVRYSADPSSQGGSVAMRRISNDPYEIDTFLTPLNTVAGNTKHMDPAHIAPGDNDITPAFESYVRPLVGTLPVMGSFDEMKR